jgi:hypothetical protein
MHVPQSAHTDAHMLSHWLWTTQNMLSFTVYRAVTIPLAATMQRNKSRTDTRLILRVILSFDLRPPSSTSPAHHGKKQMNPNANAKDERCRAFISKV